MECSNQILEWFVSFTMLVTPFKDLKITALLLDLPNSFDITAEATMSVEGSYHNYCEAVFQLIVREGQLLEMEKAHAQATDGQVWQH